MQEYVLTGEKLRAWEAAYISKFVHVAEQFQELRLIMEQSKLDFSNFSIL